MSINLDCLKKCNVVNESITFSENGINIDCPYELNIRSPLQLMIEIEVPQIEKVVPMYNPETKSKELRVELNSNVSTT